MESNERKIIFVAPENSLGPRFQHYRKIKNFTDVKVKAGKIEMDAHRIVLEGASPVIKELFESSRFDGKVLRFPSKYVKSKVLEDLLNVFYTIQIEISDQNVFSLCIASHFLDIPNLLKECETFLLDGIFNRNIADLYCLSCNLELKILKQHCINFFENNNTKYSFVNIFENLKLLNLNFDEIEEFLKIIIVGNKQQNFQVLNLKENIFHFIKSWVENDFESRETFYPNLLQILPLKELPDSFLMKHVLSPPLIDKFPSCSKLFNETLEEIRSASQTFNGSRLYCLRGKISGLEICYLNVLNGKWRTLIKIPKLGIMSGTAIIIGKNIYFCDHHMDKSKHLRMFDCERETWTTLSRMPLDVRLTQMTTINGLLFIAGGSRSSVFSPISNVFQYSLTTNKWTEVKEMNEERCFHRLVALNGLIYAIGGSRNETIECYNPATNEWKYVAPFGYTGENFSAIPHQNKIYALSYQKFKVFNPENNTWKKLSYPPVGKRNGFTGKLVSFNDKLLLFGGINLECTAKSKALFEFNTIKKSWNKLLDIDHELWFNETVAVNL